LLPCQQAHSYHKECIDPWYVHCMLLSNIFRQA
jgi:hypothetical protein